MKTDIIIDYLADHPDLLAVLASWFYAEWGHSKPDFTTQFFEDELRGRMNRDQLPLTLVAFLNDNPVATVSLLLEEMETHPQFLHWLGSVYTLPDYRHHGIGSQLLEHAASEAKRLGVRQLYLWTRHVESLYARFGWVVIQRPVYRGRPVAIMRRSL